MPSAIPKEESPAGASARVSALAESDAVKPSCVTAHLRLYRVPEWAHILPLPLATFDLAAPLDVSLPAAARGIANAFAILAFGFLLNAVSDRHVDRDTRKNPLLLPASVDYRWSLALLPTLSVLLASFSPWPAQLATFACLFLGCVYSVGPRLKSIPVVGSLLNAVGFTPILILGMSGPELPPGFGNVALTFAALLLQNQFLHEAGDCIEDRASGIRTTWLTLGPRWTALLAAGAGLAALLAAAGVTAAGGQVAVLLLIGGVFGLGFPLLLARPQLSPASAARLRVYHRWCSVAAGSSLYLAWRLAP